MKIITEKEVEKSINLEEAFKFIEKSYADFSDGKTVTPATTSMEVNDGMFYSFPSFIKGRKVFISKQATDFRNNKKYGLPSVHPYILVFDSKTGILESIIEGRYFAAIRTSLSSAVGIKHFSEKPVKLAILGTGVQGKTHAIVLSSLFKSIKEISVYSPTKKHRESCVKELKKKLKVKLLCAESSEEAVKGADIIICATTSSKPVFDNKDVKNDVLVVGVGAMKNDQEIPAETMGEALVVVDAEKNIPMYDEIKIAKEKKFSVNVVGEMGEVINRKKSMIKGRKIVFKHHGLPVTDAALAENILRKIGVLQ
ncbi:ornithine cyclodeaminase family protein [Candidatus Woesearchaeota archaeon]|nr:ornithine cyclodeaminase family protein [Candidatus Woesearchaeota archaeon]